MGIVKVHTTRQCGGVGVRITLTLPHGQCSDHNAVGSRDVTVGGSVTRAHAIAQTAACSRDANVSETVTRGHVSVHASVMLCEI